MSAASPVSVSPDERPQLALFGRHTEKNAAQRNSNPSQTLRPGGLDYVLLVLIKWGWVSKQTEKKLNRLIQLWIRAPGAARRACNGQQACCGSNRPAAGPSRLLRVNQACCGPSRPGPTHSTLPSPSPPQGCVVHSWLTWHLYLEAHKRHVNPDIPDRYETSPSPMFGLEASRICVYVRSSAPGVVRLAP